MSEAEFVAFFTDFISRPEVWVLGTLLDVLFWGSILKRLFGRKQEATG